MTHPFPFPLARRDIVPIPTALFRACHHIAEQRVVRDISIAVAMDRVLTLESFQRALPYPGAIAAYLTEERFRTLPDEHRSLFLNSPYYAFALLHLDYDSFSPWLESHFYHDSSFLEALIRMADELPSFKMRLGREEYRRMLLHDPARFIALSPEGLRQKEVSHLVVQLAARSASSLPFDSAWAFFGLEISADCHPDKLTINAISQNGENGFLAAHLLRKRSSSPQFINSLALSVDEPQWAFHFLRDHLFDASISPNGVSPEEHLLDVLTRSPEWTAEYIDASSIDLDAADAIYRLAVSSSYAHPLNNLLHVFFHRKFCRAAAEFLVAA
jgi:hypothetical protein